MADSFNYMVASNCKKLFVTDDGLFFCLVWNELVVFLKLFYGVYNIYTFLPQFSDTDFVFIYIY